MVEKHYAAFILISLEIWRGLADWASWIATPDRRIERRAYVDLLVNSDNVIDAQAVDCRGSPPEFGENAIGVLSKRWHWIHENRQSIRRAWWQ